MAVDLRPLSLPELLDRSFSAYRRHLWLFVGIMAAPSACALAGTLLLELFNRAIQPGTPPAQVWRAMWPVLAAALGFSIVYLVAYAFACGATSVAVSELNQGRPPTVRSAYAAVRQHSVRLVLLLIWATLRVFGVFVGLIILSGVLAGFSALISRVLAIFVVPLGFFVSLVVFVWMSVRYGVAVPALVLEGEKAGVSLRRSVELTSGHRWRVFLVMLCAVIIAYATAALFQGPFIGAAWIAGPGTPAAIGFSVAGAVCGGIGGMFSGPIMLIGLAMVYYDLRIRKEALDLDLMLAATEAPRSASGAQAAQG